MRAAGAIAATGFADVEAGRPMTPGSRMPAAGIGKAFAGATGLAPESEGCLSQANRPDLPGAAVGYAIPDNRFGLPERTAGEEGRPVRIPGVVPTRGELASTAGDPARRGHAPFGGEPTRAAYPDRLLDGLSVAPGAPGIRSGAGVVDGSSDFVPVLAAALADLAMDAGQ